MNGTLDIDVYTLNAFIVCSDFNPSKWESNHIVLRRIGIN